MVDYLKRSVLEQTPSEKIEYKKQISGFLFYIFVFGIVIPYFILRFKKIGWLEGYLPNLDLIATILGFRGGPVDSNIFRYLYNPVTTTTYGFFSQNVLNYVALLGLTYIVAYYTFTTKSISNGWSRAFIMIIITFLLPSNLLAYGTSKFGLCLDKILGTTKYTYGITIALFLVVLYYLIILEKNLIQYFAPIIAKNIDKVIDYVKSF